MECRKLYYEDCLLRSFTATVASCEETEKGWEVTLDTTAFYPEGGGQACDLGTLGSARVLDVRERDGKIIHLCDGPVSGTVEGCLDWERRFDLMQQHTGEHILSGLIYARFGWHNTGFHVGKDAMEVDFDGPIPPDALAQLELAANAIVWENRPLKCWIPSPEQLPEVSYRTKRALDWPVRIVEVPGADTCACCGVHVATTGQVGLIKILSAAKFHQGIRIQLVCGKRAYDHIAAVYEQNRQVSQVFSAKVLETGLAAQKATEALAAEKLRANTLQSQLFDRIAEDYVNQENVLHFAPPLDGGALRELAEKISAQCSGYAAVFCLKEGGFAYCLAQPGGDLRQLCKDMNGALNGRGGGKPPFQQGTVSATGEEIRTFFGA